MTSVPRVMVDSFLSMVLFAVSILFAWVSDRVGMIMAVFLTVLMAPKFILLLLRFLNAVHEYSRRRRDVDAVIKTTREG